MTLRPVLQRYGTLLALLLIAAAFAGLSPAAFGTAANLINITQQMSLLAVIALGATFVMVVGEFDLSVSAVASWSGIAVVALLHAGLSWPAACLLALVSSGVSGLLAGILTMVFAVPSFIGTLAIGTILGGLTFWVSGGATLFGGLPDGLRALGRGGIGPLPVLTLWMLGVAVCSWTVLGQVEFGRRLYAIGGNREAARLAGVPVRRDAAIAFGLSALLAGLVGILLTARLGSAHPTGGGGFLLQAYAAIFLGMTAFREGEPNVPGTLVGAAIIAVLANGLTILNVPSFIQDMLTGTIILAAVLVRRFAGRGG